MRVGEWSFRDNQWGHDHCGLLQVEEVEASGAFRTRTTRRYHQPGRFDNHHQSAIPFHHQQQHGWYRNKLAHQQARCQRWEWHGRIRRDSWLSNDNYGMYGTSNTNYGLSARARVHLVCMPERTTLQKLRPSFLAITLATITSAASLPVTMRYTLMAPRCSMAQWELG